jgi:hypothetical protein
MAGAFQDHPNKGAGFCILYNSQNKQQRSHQGLFLGLQSYSKDQANKDQANLEHCMFASCQKDIRLRHPTGAMNASPFAIGRTPFTPAERLPVQQQ